VTTSHGTDEKLTNEHKRVLGGAFAPMISQMILEQTGTAIYIGVYIAVLCVCSMLAVVAVPKAIQGRALGE